MDEKVIVKVSKSGKLVLSKEFKNYLSALDFAKKRVCCFGDTVVVLRTCNEKVWSKTTLFPPEAI